MMSTEPARPSWTARRALPVAAALLAIQFALATISARRENPTIDEVIHLPAGISYWQAGTFRLYRHNPPLVKLVAALPALFGADRASTSKLYASDPWTAEPPNKAEFAHLFARENATQYFEIFARSRLLMPLFSALGGLVVFAWSRRLFGDGGGLLSLALWCLCPNILAHSRLITTDVGATAIGAGATYLFWRSLHRPTWPRATLAGLALGLAQLSKFSMVLLYGLWPAIWLVGMIAHRPTPRRLAGAGARGAAMVALSVLVIEAGYGFEGVGRRLGDFDFLCRTLTVDRPGRPILAGDEMARVGQLRVNRFRGTSLAGLPVPLPVHYVLGFDDQKLEAEGLPMRAFRADSAPDTLIGYPVYLDGELRSRSWWYYYLFTLAYKVPEGTLALAGLTAVVAIAGRRNRCPALDEAAVWAVPAVVLGVMSVATNINLGLRYVLPIFPYVFIGMGRLVPWASGLGRWRAGAFTLVGALLTATALSTAMIHPHYLAYFNRVAGGPDRGADHLIDSNIDWGQDLVGLKRWLDANAPGERVGIAYFGQIHPSIFKLRGEPIDWFLPPALPGTMRGRPTAPPPPGLYAVSASMAKGLPWRVYDPGRWSPYRAEMHAYSYFDKLTPFAKIGGSIGLYRVSAADAERLSRQWAR